MVSERDPVRRRLSRPVTFRGVGVHSGADAVCVVGPGSDGVVFRRSDDGGTVEASWRNVAATRLQTVIQGETTSVATSSRQLSPPAGIQLPATSAFSSQSTSRNAAPMSAGCSCMMFQVLRSIS